MRSILLVKTSSMGDVIHNLPVVSDLRRIWPELAIDWVVEESFAAIPRLHPSVRRVIPVAVRRWRKQLTQRDTWREIGAFRQELQRECYDLILDTQGLVKSALITWLTRGLRCGYSAEVARERLAALAYHCDYLIPPSAHAVERNRWLASAAAEYPLIDLPLDYGIHANAPRPAWLPDSPFCTLLSATSRDDKLWPEAHWIALGTRLREKGLRCVLPSGSPRERERAERLASGIPDAIAAPSSDLETLAAVLSASEAVIGVDTGLTHLAASLDRPTLALYVATEPGLTGVLAGPRAINLGGKGLCPSPEDVLNPLEALLAEEVP